MKTRKVSHHTKTCKMMLIVGLLLTLISCGASDELDEIGDAFDDLSDSLPDGDPCTSNYYQSVPGTYRGDVSYSRSSDGVETENCTWSVVMTVRSGLTDPFHCGIEADISATVAQTYQWPSTDDRAHQCREVLQQTRRISDQHSLDTDPAVIDQEPYPKFWTFFGSSEAQPSEGPYLMPYESDQVSDVSYVYLIALLGGAVSSAQFTANGTIEMLSNSTSDNNSLVGTLIRD